MREDKEEEWERRLTAFEMRKILPWWKQPANGFNAFLMRLATRLGNGWIWVLVAPSILVAIGPRRGLALAWRATAVGLVSVCVYKFLKSRFNRPRPYENQGLEPLHAPPDRFSFPSGHAMNNIAVALYIGHFLPPALSILLPFAVLVSFSRVYLRVHYPSDVLVGATLGLLIGEIAPHVPHFTSISKLF